MKVNTFQKGHRNMNEQVTEVMPYGDSGLVIYVSADDIHYSVTGISYTVRGEKKRVLQLYFDDGTEVNDPYGYEAIDYINQVVANDTLSNQPDNSWVKRIRTVEVTYIP